MLRSVENIWIEKGSEWGVESLNIMKLREILNMSYKQFMERLTDEDIENIERIFKGSSSSNIYSDAQGIYDDGARLGCNNLDDEYLDISKYFRLVREQEEEANEYREEYRREQEEKWEEYCENLK